VPGSKPKPEGSQRLPEELLPELSRLKDEEARSQYLDAHQEMLRADVVAWLTDVVREQARRDTQSTLAIAEFTVTLARKLRNEGSLGEALRAKANALYVNGQNRAAIAHHEQALEIFRRIGNSTELGRTLSSSIQPLVLVGEYDRALSAAEEARAIFAKEGDDWRLARLELNAGNIYHRQDRFAEALERYELAYRHFLPHQERDPEAVAVALHNMAMCLITMNDFRRALSTYESARTFSQQHKMPLLVSQADYNIAWLYYLRGEYGPAIERLRNTRELCRKNGDHYHFALCHLDLSDIYLELNLSQEAAETAQEGAARFDQLEMGYEKAKCLVNFAIALSHEGKAFQALEIFVQARDIFVREKNHVWPSLVDLYQALVLFNEGRYFEARRLCSAALQFFDSSLLAGKAVLGHLLMARLAMATADSKTALAECQLAFTLLEKLESPVLTYQAHFLQGQIQLQSGSPYEAYRAFEQARGAMETLRSSLHGEELKIAFMKNKSDVYESLVDICLAVRRDAGGVEEAYGYIEEAKSRSLLDLMYKMGSGSSAAKVGKSDLVRNIGELREELNWYYHRIEHEQLRQEERSAEKVSSLQQEVHQREHEFLRMLRETPSLEAESLGIYAPPAESIEQIRAALPADATAIEYFRVGEGLVVAVLTRTSLEIIPITLISRVQTHLRVLQFQLAKFRLGTEYVKTFEQVLLSTIQSHLHHLYQELIAPIRDRLGSGPLLIVPHDILHYVPFHALFDGGKYLTDAHAISYAPSASIYAAGYRREINRDGKSLVLGITDAATPSIPDEVQSVARALPGSELFLGESATADLLRKKGEHSRYIHIATHGYFRQDNPMFSGVKLGDSLLSLYDLYQMELPAELITLSGCATGLNVVAAGDELLGLVRGLLSAGAQSLLLTLWDVHDRSTTEFMKAFYSYLVSGENKAVAVQHAMADLRTTHPHPYYWAPFILMGSALEAQE